MENDDFKRIWDMLAEQCDLMNDMKFTSYHHGGKINFARRIKREIDEFCAELVGRAKAEFENERDCFEHMLKDYGDGVNEIQPIHGLGTKFGDKK